MADSSRDIEFLTTREVAALLRVKERKVYDLASSGAIPCRRVTGKLLFPRAEVEAWLAGEGAGAAAPGPARRSSLPSVVAGSHDPLLDWAIRESGCALATFFDGSLDGLERMARGDALACGMHVYEPDEETWNTAHVSDAVGQRPFVLIEWARRQQGLIVPQGAKKKIRRFADLEGKRVVLRQPKAGGRILFDHLMAEAGLRPGDIVAVDSPARTETDAAAAVAGGSADTAFALESMARLFKLDFVPLKVERFDLLIDRRAYFETPMQALMAFCRSSRFAAQAETLGGYDLGAHGTVRWNGP